MLCRRLIVFFLLALVVGTAATQDLESDQNREPDESDSIAESSEGEPFPGVLGFIFNTTNLLLDIDDYQGGFGGKLRFPDYSLRALLALGYASTNSATDIGLGITYERPFFQGRVSPYWGIDVSGRFEWENIEVDEDNYTQTSLISGSAGVVLGIEVLIFDFLGVFGEYQLAGSVGQTTVTQAISGTETESDTTNFGFGASLGNEAAIGVVIYLQPLGILDETDS